MVDQQDLSVSGPTMLALISHDLLTNDCCHRVGLLNSIAGLLSTLINVYSQHGGRFSITAKITVCATASCTVITAILYFLYNFWILQGVRKKHEQELELEAGKRATLYQSPESE